MAIPFRVWLQRTHRKLLFDLPKAEAHALFDSFVAAYNAGRVDPDLLRGDTMSEAAAALPRTAHKWVLKLSAADAEQLASVADGVTAALKLISSNTASRGR